jgi:hypothetical protein
MIAQATALLSAPETSSPRTPSPDWHTTFLTMLPKIQDHARFRFRHLTDDRLEDAAQEVVCNCLVAYASLVEQGRATAATWSSLAKFAVAQVRSGRRVGTSLNIKDITSSYCQQRKHIAVESLHHWDPQDQEWREILVEDQTATPADLAACRIDFPAWLNTLSRRDRKIALTLSQGEATHRVAQLFRLSAGRVSQLRRELCEAWQRFQGEISLDTDMALAPVL